MSVEPSGVPAEALPDQPPRVNDSEMLAALAPLGRALEVQFAAPRRGAASGPFPQRAAAIAQASALRTRQVRLVDDWWRSDHGPLLAVRREGQAGQPVVLVPAPWGGGYEWLDPRDGRRRRLDAALRAELAPEAMCFYRPLPGDVRTVGGLLRFALAAFGRDLVWAGAVTLAAAGLAACVPLAGKLIVDAAVPQADLGLVAQLACLLAAVGAAQVLFEVAEQFASLRFMLGASATLQAAVWDRLLRLPMSFFRRYTSGDLLNRSLMVSQVSEVLGASLLRWMLTALLVVVQLGLLFWFSWRLALVVLPAALLVAAASGAIAWHLARRARDLERRRGRLLGFVVQLILGVAKLRAAGAADRALARWADQYRPQLDATLAVRSLHDAQAVLKALTPHLMILLIYPSVAWLAGSTGHDALPLGSLLGFTTALGMFTSGLGSVAQAVVDVTHALAQQELAGPLLEAAPEPRRGRADPGPLGGALEARGLSFRYDLHRRRALEAVTLSAAPGEFIAVTGPSGSGKSTLLRLLLGLEQPEAGCVLYDGRDLRGLDLTLVRRQVGAVLQTSQVVAGTLLDNIAAGRPVTLEQVWEAAADAALAEEIAALPMGLFTIVTERGANLSGGQRQRLLLARALVGNPQILLLDEATSALDGAAQAAVVQNLARRKVTRIVVAHRRQTLAGADRVYVLNEGRLVDAAQSSRL